MLDWDIRILGFPLPSLDLSGMRQCHIPLLGMHVLSGFVPAFLAQRD
jgi:hypothetical protein